MPGMTLHTLYPSTTPVLSGIIMPLYYRPCGDQSPPAVPGAVHGDVHLPLARLRLWGLVLSVMIPLRAHRGNTGWYEP